MAPLAGAEQTQAPAPMEDENIVVRLTPPDELLESVDRGEIVHGVHVGAILLAARRGWI
jgi:hypothetical protein